MDLAAARRVFAWSVAFIAVVLPVVSCTGQPGTPPPVTRVPVKPASLPAPTQPIAAAGTAAPGGTGPAGAFRLASPAFAAGADIPPVYTCDGQNQSPALQWTGTPVGTQSFVLVMYDTDAKFTHWVQFNIPASQTALPAGVQPGQAGTTIRNDFGRAGYGGPCPPKGQIHTYVFTLYALDVPSISLQDGTRKPQVEQAIQGHEVGRAETNGRYARR